VGEGPVGALCYYRVHSACSKRIPQPVSWYANGTLDMTPSSCEN
jgi:hypothetical protein